MDISKLNNTLADLPYVSGYVPSQEDVKVAQQLAKSDLSTNVHVKRWLKHMASFSDAEKKAFPGAPAPAKAAAGGGDDDDIDLFGSDEDEEAEAARQERVKAYQEKKQAKPATIAKSTILLDVKPWDDETNVDEIEKLVRGIQCDGLIWGAAKKIPLAYGIHKLTIVCVVEDAKVSIDWLTEQIENFELVQSTDIAAFQKI